MHLLSVSLSQSQSVKDTLLGMHSLSVTLLGMHIFAPITHQQHVFRKPERLQGEKKPFNQSALGQNFWK